MASMRRSLALLSLLALGLVFAYWHYSSPSLQDERLFFLNSSAEEFDDSPEPVEMESDELRPDEARTYELRPHERRGLKRSADHQPREFFREQVAKPLPWEWDLRRLTAHSFPATASSLSPATTGVGGLRAPRWLRDVTSLDDLMAKYAVLHERILSGELPPRYVVFVSNPEYGYGNKIQVMVSTFVFALMSERAILIDWPQSLNVQMAHRKDFKGAAPMVANLDHRELFEPPPGVQWDLTAPLRARFTKAQQANATKQFREFSTIGVCEDLYMWEHNVEWVSISGWDFFATFLLNNAHHDNVNRVLRPFHDQLLYVLANALRIIHPTRSIKSAAESVRNRLFAPYRNEGILGIHLRTSHPEIPVTPSLIVQMIRCGLVSGYKVWYLATEDKIWYNRFAKLLRQHDTGLAVDDFGSLNGTGSPGPRRRVKLLFLDRNVTERNSFEGTRNALSDMFLLTACDDFMMLWGTTFGRLVAAIGGFKEPVTVMKHQRLCVRKLTSEPCVYTWDQLQSAPCYNNAMQLPSMLYSSDAPCREF